MVAKFGRTTTNETIEISHAEEAWKKNFNDGKKLISYIDALYFRTCRHKPELSVTSYRILDVLHFILKIRKHCNGFRKRLAMALTNVGLETRQGYAIITL